MTIPTTEYIVSDITRGFHPNKLAETILPALFYTPDGEALLNAYLKHRNVRGVYRVEWNALFPNPMERVLKQLVVKYGEQRLLELTEGEIDGIYALEPSRLYVNRSGRVHYAGYLTDVREGITFGHNNKPAGAIPEIEDSGFMPAVLDEDGRAIISAGGYTVNYGYLPEVAGIINTATVITFD